MKTLYFYLIIISVIKLGHGQDSITFSNAPNQNIYLNSEQINSILIDRCVFQIVGDNTIKGSGFFINSEGYALTNEHVLRNNHNVRAKFTDGTVQEFTVIAQSRKEDLALLKMEGTNYDYLPLAYAKEISKGDKIFVIGVLGNTKSKIYGGWVNATDETINGIRCFQTDAWINPGNSGGPLIGNGKVYGIVTTKDPVVEREGYATFSEEAIKLFNLIEKSNNISKEDTVLSKNVQEDIERIEGLSKAYEIGKNTYKIEYDNTILGYIELPDLKYATLYLQNGDSPKKEDVEFLKDAKGKKVNVIGKDELINNLGYYIYIANQKGKRLVIGATERDNKWLAANDIRFSKNGKNLKPLEHTDMWSLNTDEVLPMQGWINYDYVK